MKSPFKKFVLRKKSSKKKVKGKVVYKHSYYFKGRKVSSKAIQKKLPKAYFPPAYDNLFINIDPAEKELLAIGSDEAGRDQYIYHPSFEAKRGKRIMNELKEFGKALPKLEKALKRDQRSNDDKKREVSTALRMIQTCNFRVGSKQSVKMKHYGVSTILKKHVKNKSGKIVVDFIGKKGVRYVEKFF